MDKLADAVDLSLYMRSRGKSEFESFLGSLCLQSNDCTPFNLKSTMRHTHTQEQELFGVTKLELDLKLTVGLSLF